MSYKLGMPTLIEFNSIRENLDFCSSLDLEFIELNMNLPYCMPDNNDAKELKRIIGAHNIGLTMHFPEEIDLAAFYPSVRASNLQLFRELADYGAKLGVSKINLHINSGVYFSLPDHKTWIYDINKDRFMDNLMSSIEKVINISKEYGIKVCVENTSFPGFIKEAFCYLSKLESIYFTWDVGHDAKDNYRAGEFYMKNINKLSHMHLHDYDGFKNHLCLYDGELDIAAKIEFAKVHNMTAVVEVKTSDALRESIKRLRLKGF